MLSEVLEELVVMRMESQLQSRYGGIYASRYSQLPSNFTPNLRGQRPSPLQPVLATLSRDQKEPPPVRKKILEGEGTGRFVLVEFHETLNCSTDHPL